MYGLSYNQALMYQQEIAQLQQQLQINQNHYGQQINGLQHDVDRLRTDLRRAERNSRTYMEKNQRANQEIERLKQEIERLQRENSDLTHELQSRIDELRRNEAKEQARLDSEAMLREQKQAELKRRLLSKSSRATGESVFTTPPPRIVVNQAASSPPTPTPVQGSRGNANDHYDTVGPSGMAGPSGGFGSMMAGHGNDRRMVSFGANTSAQSSNMARSQKSYRPSIFGLDVFAPVFRPPSAHTGLSDEDDNGFLGGPIPLPVNVEGTIAHAEAMLVKFQSRDERLGQISVLFDNLSKMILGWAAQYAKKEGKVILGPVQTDNDESRNAMLLSCLGLPFNDEASRILKQLIESKHVVYIIAALIWRFCYVELMHPSVYVGLVPGFEKIVRMHEELHRTNSNISASQRAAMMAERTRAVYEVLQHKDFAVKRAKAIEGAMSQLRQFLKPFVDRPSSSAASDLNSIALKAFEILGKTITENGILIFQDKSVGDRFQPSCMEIAGNHRDPPSVMYGAKLKLCVIPAITFRDDSAGNIFTKMTNKARVVLEDPPTAWQ